MPDPEQRARDEWLLPTLAELMPREALEQLAAARPACFWDAAVGRALVRDDAILHALAFRYHLPVADLDTAADGARALLSEVIARRYGVAPLRDASGTLEIATADPTDPYAEQVIAFATGRRVAFTLAPPAWLARRLDELYGARPAEAQAPIAEFGAPSSDGPGAEQPVMRLVDHILTEGIRSGASDIHVEAEEGEIAVRYRIDGVLRQALTLPRAVGVPLASRIKIISGLDIADRLRPQDGRARVEANGRPVDLRVSTLPAAHGEKIVVRILDGRSIIVSLDAMGLHPDDLRRIAHLLQAREGFVLVTGPTGSGKTTTLYSALRQIQRRGVNIVTVEDPVEYRLPGIVQVQVHEKAGLTFAAALRSILRQDPDVVLVGEIRDRETAGIAVQAAMTGHLVLSTLHTIDAVSSITRLADIGVDSFRIAAALRGIVAQRLLRRLCPACRAPSAAPVPARLRPWVPPDVTHYCAVGCAECAGLGYRGRMAVAEVLTITPEIERRIAAAEPAVRILEAARAFGMRSLWESAVWHLRAGATSIEEVVRVLDIPHDAGRGRGAPAGEPRRTTERAAGAPSSGGGDPAAAAPPPAADRPLTVLVAGADDARGDLRVALARGDFRLVEAGDGGEVLARLDHERPDVLVLGADVPPAGAGDVLRRLRAGPAAALPVLVLAAAASEDDELAAFEMGASDCVVTPVRRRAFAARVRALARRP